MKSKNKSKLLPLPLLIIILASTIFPDGKRANSSIKNIATQEADIEYAYLQKQIDFYKKNNMPPSLIEQTINAQALIHKSDRDPLDVLLRRTDALLSHLQQLNDTPDLKKEAKAFARLSSVLPLALLSRRNSRKNG